MGDVEADETYIGGNARNMDGISSLKMLRN